MKKLLSFAAVVAVATVAGLYLASFVRLAHPAGILAYGNPTDRGIHRCSVTESVITHQGERVPMVGLSCPMEPKYRPMYMSFMRPVGQQDAPIVDGEEYECRVYEHSVFWRYWFHKTYSYEDCLLIGKKHRA